MKKNVKRVIAMSAALMLSASAMASCAAAGGGGNNGQATLYVYSFTSGFGSEWLTSLISDYEEKMKDVEIAGKKGINIEPTAEKSDVAGSQMRGRSEVIYFLEQQDYYELLSGNYIADITSAITSTNPYDGKTLESKMFEDQKSYFGRTIDGEVHYYAYPHYFTSFGIAYDVTLFDTKGYYFADGYDPSGELADMFVGTEGWTKTAGPDGEKGSDDDGLPTTYEEFFLLCDYISGVGNDNPVVWTGQYRNSYLTHFINAMVTDYNGYEQMRLNYEFDGTATNLGKVVDGVFVPDEKDTYIDGTNGYELARQAGKYYAMNFYKTLFDKPYVQNKQGTLFGSSYSHLTAQQDFLKKSTTRNAMLLDGSWWQTEATDMFVAMGKLDNNDSKQNRKIGWMPLPKATSEQVGEKATMFDIMYPLCVMKNGLDVNSWEYKYALDFIQFANSDEQLAKFTKITSCTKALNYDLTGAQYDALTPFGQSFYDAYKKADIVFPYDNNLLFANNQTTFNEIGNDNGSAFYKSKDYSTYFTTALEKGHTVGAYFNGMYDYFKELNIWRTSK